MVKVLILLSDSFAIKATIKEESIPPDKNAHRGTSEISFCLTDLEIKLSNF